MLTPPFKAEIVDSVWVKNATELELDLHNRYGNRRVSGEWFVLTKEDVRDIKRIFSMDKIASRGEQCLSE